MTQHSRRDVERVFNDMALPDDFSAHSVKSQCKKPFSAKFFDYQNDMIKILAKRVGFDVSMINIRVANGNEISPEQATLINDALCDVMEKELRKTDQVFDKTADVTEFSIVLPGTSIDNAQVVIAKIQRGLKKIAPKLLEKTKYSYSVCPLYA